MGGAIAAPTDAELGAEIETAAPPEAAAPEAEASAPEGQQEQPQEQEQEKRQRFVPHEALHEARTREREAREEAKAARQVLERLVAIQERQAQPQGKADAPAIPDLETDPVGHFKAKYEALERTVQQVQQPFQRQQFIAAYASKASEFKAEAPDFDAAYAHAQGALSKLAGFYGITPADAEIQLAEAAMRQGKNPGQAIYEFAKANGYTGPKAAPEQKAAPDLSAVARGQEAARGRGGLPSAGGELTVEALAKMSFKEIAKIPSEKLDRIMGAR